MGFNTAAIILNDALSSLDRDDAGRHIRSAIQAGSRGEGWTPVGVTVLPSQHADTVQIVAVGGNRIFTLGYGNWRDDPESLLRALADQIGFRVVRKRSAKSAAQ